MAVAVDVAPERGDAVDVAAAVGVDQVGALAALDHQRLFLAPALLLGEGVPEVVVIELRGVRRHRRDDLRCELRPESGYESLCDYTHRCYIDPCHDRPDG